MGTLTMFRPGEQILIEGCKENKEEELVITVEDDQGELVNIEGAEFPIPKHTITSRSGQCDGPRHKIIPRHAAFVRALLTK